MKPFPAFKRADNSDGYILVTSLMIMTILVFIGMFALNTTTTELRVATNDRVAKEDLYNQEGCLSTGKFDYRNWLTTAYLTNSETTAFFPGNGTDANANNINDTSECVDGTGRVLGSYKVKNIEATGTPINNWQDIANFKNTGAILPVDHPANNTPVMRHKDKPDPVSESNMAEKGYDPKNFEIRRFAITSYSPENDRSAVLQQGTFKVFNKY